MIYKNIADFIKKRTIELVGLALISLALLLAISFFSYSPSDPSFMHGTENIVINNLLGIYGGLIADFLLQSFGITAFLILITMSIWGISLIIKKEIKKIQFKLFYLILCLIFSCVFIFLTFNNSFWLIDNGNSGFIGEILYNWLFNFLPNINNKYFTFIFLFLGLFFFYFSF
jgi:S-DNA-T family DNA segregation ATPase FtsK/SpoIIIE